MVSYAEELNSLLPLVVRYIVVKIVGRNSYLRSYQDEVESAAYVGVTMAHNTYDSRKACSYKSWLYRRGLWATRDELRRTHLTTRAGEAQRRRSVIRRIADIDCVVDDQDDVHTLFEFIPSTSKASQTPFSKKEHRQDFRKLLINLRPEERRVVERVFFDGLLQKEVANEMSVTESRISQIIINALQKLKSRFERDRSLLLVAS